MQLDNVLIKHVTAEGSTNHVTYAKVLAGCMQTCFAGPTAPVAALSIGIRMAMCTFIITRGMMCNLTDLVLSHFLLVLTKPGL
jgi:hypothetical protein